MFNATLLGSARLWFNELLPESIDSFKDLRRNFLAHYLQQKSSGSTNIKSGSTIVSTGRVAGTIHIGLWYLKDTGMSLTTYTDADHAGCQETRRSTSGSAQFLGDKLVSWSSKKQKRTVISSTEANNNASSGVVLKPMG
ncbi:uncharacterized mitochondrial protein-like protein [Tanacetum coccineum]